MKKKLLIGMFAVVLLAGGRAYYSLFGPNPAEAAREFPLLEPAAIVRLDPFLTNIADERRARVQVALAVAPVSLSEEIQTDALVIARLRDKILTMLAARTYEELNTPSGKEDFRNQVRSAAQRVIADGVVQEALFVDFVIQ
jgi:flagellar basal body-associated protein FliL